MSPTDPEVLRARFRTMAPDPLRHDPATFQLPVGRLRAGYYSDAYFNSTKELLEAEDRRPQALMQVFQKQESLLAAPPGAFRLSTIARGPTADAGIPVP